MELASVLRSDPASQTYVLDGRARRSLRWGDARMAERPWGVVERDADNAFSVQWSSEELATLLVGEHAFVELGFSDATDALVELGLSLAMPDGEIGAVSFDADLPAVVTWGEVRFRLSGRADSPARLVLGDSTRRIPRGTFAVDLAPAEIESGLRSGMTVQTDVGETTLTWSVRVVSPSARDLEQRPGCSSEVSACLRALPSGELDLAECGTAESIGACTDETGVFVEPDTLKRFIRARRLSPAMQASLEGQIGRWYPNPASLERALQEEVKPTRETHHVAINADAKH